MGLTAFQTVSAVLALVGTAATGTWGAFAWIQGEHDSIRAETVSSEEYRDFQWVYMTKQIRELEERAEAGDDRAREDLEELMDLFCRRYPEDRRCRGR